MDSINQTIQKIIEGNEISFDKLSISKSQVLNPNYTLYSKTNNQIMILFQNASNKSLKLILYDINSNTPYNFSINFMSKDQHQHRKIDPPLITKIQISYGFNSDNEKLVFFSDDIIYNQLIGYLPLKNILTKHKEKDKDHSDFNTKEGN